VEISENKTQNGREKVANASDHSAIEVIGQLERSSCILLEILLYHFNRRLTKAYENLKPANPVLP
jgi:hypothetical protein